MEKAYKLLAIQEKISNNIAKDLIDRGIVFSKGKKVMIARAMLDKDSKFKILNQEKPKKIFEDDKLFVIDKPPFITSEEIMKMFGYPLVHRLDKETSGVLMLSKDEDFLKKVISEFRSRRVYKEYIAVVEGIIPEETTISKKIKIIKGNSAKAIIDKNGEEAITHIVPIEVFASKTKLKVDIITGKTHQIRVHLKSIAHPIVGDTLYGGKEEKRILLHSHIVKLFDYEFVSPEPKEFQL